MKKKPFPAASVSTVKLAGDPTIAPNGSIPGPYATTLHKINYSHFYLFFTFCCN